jgi:hypothetical protein
LTDDNLVDFNLYVLNDAFAVLYQSTSTGHIDEVQITTSIQKTYIITVYGYWGVGSFNLVVTEYTPPTTTPNTTAPTGLFNGFVFIVAILGIIAVASIYRIFVKKKA